MFPTAYASYRRPAMSHSPSRVRGGQALAVAFQRVRRTTQALGEEVRLPDPRVGHPRGEVIRRTLATSDWARAHQIAEKYSDADSWTATAKPAAVFARCPSGATRASCLVAVGSKAALVCDTGAPLDYLVKDAPDQPALPRG